MIKLGHVYIVFLCILNFFRLPAQDLPLLDAASSVYPVFASNASEIHFFGGFLEGKQEFEIVFFENESEWKGLYRMKSSGTTFRLESSVDNEILSFTELDDSGRITGNIVGFWEEGIFFGKWTDVGGTTSIDFEFSDQSNAYKLGRNKTLQVFTTERKSKRTPITLYIKTIGNIKEARLYWEGKEVITELTCISEDCLQMEGVGLTNELSYLTFETKADHTYLVFRTGKESAQAVSLKEIHNLPFDHTYFSNYTSNIEMSVLQGNKTWNKWLSTQTEFWKKTELERISKIEQDHLDHGVRDRWSEKVYFETIIDFVSEKLISGLLEFYSNTTGKYEQVPFIFDLEKGREIKISEVFIYSETAFSSMNAKCHKALANKLWPQEIISWLNTLSYDVVTITPNGFKIRHPYSSIYGQYPITLPFGEFKDNIHPQFLKMIQWH